MDSAQRYEQAFLKKHQMLFQLSSDLIDEVWKDRPPNDATPVIVHPVEFAGRSVAEKINDLREKLQHEKASGIIVTALDEVQLIDLHLGFTHSVQSIKLTILISSFYNPLLGCLVVQCSGK